MGSVTQLRKSACSGALTSAPEQGEGGTTNVYYQPSVEIVQEFKVANNSFSAEYGNNGGTVVNLVLKEGGNKFHGSGWWFGQRSALDANDFSNNAAGVRGCRAVTRIAKVFLLAR